jgi:putative flippase GtrA
VLRSLRDQIIAKKTELVRFCVVGGIGAIIDLGGADYLYRDVHLNPLASKAISISVATVVTYLGSRFWTFRHRVDQEQALGRETGMFFLLNVIGLLIAEACIAFTSYGLDLKGHLAYNAASVVGTGLGTIFRYFSYRKWVFNAAAAPVPAAGYYGPAEEHLETAAETAD